jgi:hypothetical protein
MTDKPLDCGSIAIPKAALDELWTAIDSQDHAYIVEVARGIDRVSKPVQAMECRSVFSDDDLRRLLEWHEEVRSTCGISADDDNLRKRIVGALRRTEQESITQGQRIEAARIAVERDLQEWKSIREGSPLEVRSKGFLVAAAINGLEKILQSLGGATEEKSKGQGGDDGD